MAQEELTLLLVVATVLFISISYYTIWIRLDLWAAKRALEHMSRIPSAPGGEDHPGCIGFVMWSLLAATVISFLVFVR
jgi:hypothetical protein